MLRSRSRPQEASADAGQVSERLDSGRKDTFVQLLASCAQLWRQDDGVSRFGLSKAGRFLVAVAVDNTAGDRFAGEADGPGLRPG
jgi:hypothetical protein